MKGIKRLVFLSLASIGLGFSPVSQATLLFDNGTISSGNQSAASDVDSSLIWADNFSLSFSSTVNQIRWRGILGSSSGPGTFIGTDDFTIRIYSDNSGPDSQLQEYLIGNSVSRSPSGSTNAFGTPVINYTANIAPTILQANTTYWISIFNNTTADTDDVWRWIYGAQSNPNGSSVGSSNLGTSWTSNFASDYSFQLEGSVAPVPVPAAVWLMGSALLGLVGFSRKKSS